MDITLQSCIALYYSEKALDMQCGGGSHKTTLLRSIFGVVIQYFGSSCVGLYAVIEMLEGEEEMMEKPSE